MKKQLLTYDQILDWLIYHIPLHDTGMTSHPYSVTFIPAQWFFCGTLLKLSYMDENPWRCYEVVAWKIHRDEEVRERLTTLYYNS